MDQERLTAHVYTKISTESKKRIAIGQQRCRFRHEAQTKNH